MAKAEQPIRITTAGASRASEIAQRQKRYMISMTIRVLCFVGAILVATTLHLLWLALILILAAIVLPYIAVVAANAVHSKGEDLRLLDSPFGRPELRGGKEWRDEYGDDR